jgi:guanylate kinase
MEKQAIMALVIAGPSGVGKGSLVNHIFQKYPGLFTLSISATTRKARPGEIPGKDYFFLTLEEFKQWIKEERFIEHEEVYEGIFYGTPKASVSNSQITLFDIDIAGEISVKKFYGGSALAIFLTPPEPVEENLRKRLQGRNSDDIEKINERIAKAPFEIETAKMAFENGWVDKIIVSDSERKFYSEIDQIIEELIISEAVVQRI